jgi:hypothetical protein
MCRKSFTLATFVRRSIAKLPNNNYSFPKDIIQAQIAIGKGFSAYMPVINYSFQVNYSSTLMILSSGIRLKRSLNDKLSSASSGDSIVTITE